MVSADLLELGKGAFVACCALLALSVGIGVVQLIPARPAVIAASIEWPQTWAEILAEREAEPYRAPARVTVLADWRAAELAEEAKSHRHNVHCARCGRFARAVVELPGVADCSSHGMTTRITYLAEQLAAAA